MSEHEKPQPIDSREGRILVPGGNVWFRIHNPSRSTRTPLLLLHGGPGYGSTDFASLIPLADDRPVIFYDQLGCGNSDRPDDTSLWTLERFVEELAQVNDHLVGDKPVHILGFSWGGTLAVEYMLTRQPKNVKSLILASPMLSMQQVTQDIHRRLEEMHPGALEIVRRLEQENKTDTDEYKEIIDAFDQKHVLGETMAEIPAALLETDEKKGKAVFETMVGTSEINPTGNLVGHERASELHKLKLPVLLTCGRYDEITPESTATFQKHTPHSQVVVFEESAHMAHWTQTERYIDTVSTFLADVDATAPIAA